MWHFRKKAKKQCVSLWMFYKDIENMKPGHFKRLTGVKKEVFIQMLACISTYKQQHRKHPTRGKPPALSYADKLLLMLMYYKSIAANFILASLTALRRVAYVKL